MICIWKDRCVPGFDGEDLTANKFPIVDWEEAFNTHYKTDVHVSIYTIPGETSQPRLKVGAHQWCIDREKEPRVNWVFVDVDNEDHGAWESLDEKRAAVNRLIDRPLLESAAVYTTRHGYRLVWRLGAPVLARHWKSFYTQFTDYLRANGIPVDASQTLACWATGFRLPFVTRDGKPTQPICDFSPLEDGMVLEWLPPKPLREDIGRSFTASEQELDDNVVEPTQEEWQKLLLAPYASQFVNSLKRGKILAPEGNRNNTLFKLISSIGGFFRSREPKQIWKFIRDSVRADDTRGAPSPEDAWRMCCRVAGQEEGKAQRRAEKLPRLLVHQDRHFFVLDTREEPWSYHPYSVGGNMLVQMMEDLVMVGIPGTSVRTDKGAPKPVRNLTTDYGRMINEVCYVMGEKGAEYEPEGGGTLYLGCCVPRHIEPEFSPEVDEWLKAFAGDKYESLLDWLATSTNLSKPTCALYLRGEPGTGKSMFIDAVASIWSVGATPLQEMLSNFNAGLLECPVVAADEGVSVTSNTLSTDVVFRNIVANSSHSVNQKNKPVVRVQGCARLIIAANNDNAIRFDSNLTQEDLQAIAARTLYIPVQSGASNLLEQMGGRSATENWVRDGKRPGKIAQHITWLTINRHVYPGKRFLVEGALEDWHRKFVLTTGVNSQVLFVIANCLRTNPNAKKIYVEGEHVFVSVSIVVDMWGQYLRDARTPAPKHIANALQNLSIAKTRKTIDGSRMYFWQIPFTSVSTIATEAGVPLKSMENSAGNRA